MKFALTFAALVLTAIPGSAADLNAPGSVISIQTDENVTLEAGILSTPGEIRNFVVADVDGDGLKDVVATYSLKDEKKSAVDRRFALFLNSRTGLPPNPTRTWAAPVNTVVYDVGRFRSGSKTPQLVYITPKSVLLADFSGGDPVSVYESDSWFLTPDRKNLTHYDFLLATDPDGVRELILPKGETAEILRLSAGADKAVVSSTLKLTLKADVETWSEGVMMFKRIETADGIITYRLPVLRLLDFNGDGKQDLYAIRDDKAYIYVRKADSSFTEEPQIFDFDLFSWDDIDRRSKPATIFRIEAADINGDGLGDIVVSRTDQVSLKNLELLHQTRVYYNKGGRFSVSRPDFSLKLPYWVEMPFLVDLNGDKKLDLAFLFVKFNLWTMIKAIAASSINTHLWVYLQNPDGSFPSDDSGSITISKGYQLDRLDSGLGMKPVFGDFNGDGWNDVMTNSGVDRYSIKLSNKDKKEILTDGDDADFSKVQGSYDMTSADLEDDGKPDLLVRYENMPTHWNEILVLRNKTVSK